MICPSCGSAELESATKDVAYTYKSISTTLKAVSGDFCPACGEIVMDRTQGDHYIKQVDLFKQQIDMPFHD